MKALALFLVLPTLLFADSVAPPSDPSIEAERKSFKLAPGYEIELFAAENLGIANPIAMRWGSEGRLWVLCSEVYPQLVPTEPADDHLVILEDTDKDGQADTSTVFAAGLNMPTGFALGEGGVFVGEGPNLVFLRDTDGDDRADERTILFSGFGTGDTHQNINSFTWSPDGQLYFSQGLHCFSRVETPWGIKRLDEHGVWQLRPRTRQLHAFRGGSGQNPWGFAFGQRGEPFVKGNNQQVSELLPIMVPTTHFQRPLDIGGTAIKSMICEIVDSPQLPDDLQGDMLIAGYFAHNIGRLDLQPDGSGHKAPRLDPLLTSTHRSFRPVDIQTGPDGQLYIADWFNPIIGHYQASLRHPDRDKDHGRIWRISAKGVPGREIVDLTKLDTKALVDRLPDQPLKERERIRVELSGRPSGDVQSAAMRLANTSPFEALCLIAWHEKYDQTADDLMGQVMNSKDPRDQAFAPRIAGRWTGRSVPADHLKRWKAWVRSPHPRVRLEAVVALSYSEQPWALPLALEVLDQPMDRFLEAALSQTCHALRDRWWPAFEAGELEFASPEHLSYALQRTAGKNTLATVRQLLADAPTPALRELLATIGQSGDLARLLQDHPEDGVLVSVVAEQARLRSLRPENPAALVRPLLNAKQPRSRVAGSELAALWKLPGLSPVLQKMTDADADLVVRSAALQSWATLNPEAAKTALPKRMEDLPLAALESLFALDPKTASELAVTHVRSDKGRKDIPTVLGFVLARKGADAHLASQLGALPDADKAAFRTALGATGRHSPTLLAALAPVQKEAMGMPAWSQARVRELATAAKTKGRTEEGRKVYHRPELNCVTCHKIGEAGGIIGPELTAVGAGLPEELIVEAILWPARQVKEGFLASTITDKNGRVVAGYVQRSSNQKVVRIRDAGSGSVHTIATKDIASRADAGTLMPPGLVAGLSEHEFLDLVRYLSAQR